jgi:uncharacterized membrane protein YbaN (DUF454 family)
MMKDWETYHGIRPAVRNKAIVATVVIIGITWLVASPSPALYALMAVMFVLTLVVILRLPVIQQDPLPFSANDASASLPAMA